EVLIDAEGPYSGKRLGDIQVPGLPTLTPVEIDRRGQVIPAPRPDHVLQGADRLVFAGPVADLLVLHSHSGLSMAPDHTFRSDDPQRSLVELLISDRCPLIGR